MTETGGRLKKLARGWGLRIGGTVLAFVLLSITVPLGRVKQELTHVSWETFGGVVLAIVVSLALQAGRFRFVTRAYGAREVPGFLRSAHLVFVGFFYSTFVPGNVAGDVVRAAVSKNAFHGQSTAFAVVVLERFLGLASLFFVSFIGGWAAGAPTPFVAALGVMAIGGFLGCMFAGGLLDAVRRFLPTRLRAIAEAHVDLPVAALFGPFLLSFIVGAIAHVLVSLASYLVLRELNPAVTPGIAMASVPLANVATYVPSFVGLGPRDAAMAFILGRFSIRPEHAATASIVIAGGSIVVALLAAVLQFVYPLSRSMPAPQNEADPPDQRSVSDESTTS